MGEVDEFIDGWVDELIDGCKSHHLNIFLCGCLYSYSVSRILLRWFV